ncbi:type IV pilus modification protein PilV [Aquabacterium sp.]|uniref:type IV pilus modification protein PilV n=2 Tax=Aquabacterium sp. TaxID=1872578 RepID=UPI003CFFD296
MILATPHRGPHMPRTNSAQAGVMLLEALIAILIFSVGILGIVKLQAASIQQSSAAEYRTIASMMANDVISQMWVSDKTPATLKANFESGTPYTEWRSKVIASGLPGVSATQNAPTIAITSVAAGGTGGTASNQAVVTVFWKAPHETVVHRFTAIAQIK